jgi:predicted Rossmann-fold nucleotide-binding protein
MLAWPVACAAVLLAPGPQRASGPAISMPVSGEPRVVAVSTKALERSAEVKALIGTLRDQSDALVVLSGGATMSEAKQRELLAMFEALGTLATERRIVVGDGGSEAGIMEAAGKVRRASGGAFPLVGVVPAREIPPAGQTTLDPNHSHVVAVDDPSLPPREPGWGSETATMYWLFDRLAHGRSSVAVVANGGGITLNEIAANVEFGRPIILIEGSGRAADALVALLRGTTPADAEVATLQAKAGAARLARRPDVFVIVPMATGAAGLLEAMRTALGPALPRTP